MKIAIYFQPRWHKNHTFEATNISTFIACKRKSPHPNATRRQSLTIFALRRSSLAGWSTKTCTVHLSKITPVESHVFKGQLHFCFSFKACHALTSNLHFSARRIPCGPGKIGYVPRCKGQVHCVETVLVLKYLKIENLLKTSTLSLSVSCFLDSLQTLMPYAIDTCIRRYTSK